MKKFKKLISGVLALTLICVSATGAFAESSGREETREHSIKNLNLSLVADGDYVTLMDSAPFDIGSIKVKYKDCTRGDTGVVDMFAGTTKKGTGSFSAGSGTAELATVTVSGTASGIPKGSKVQLKTYYVNATITEVTLCKENSPGIDWYIPDLSDNVNIIEAADGYSTFEVYAPFNVGAIEFSYSLNSGILSGTNSVTVQVNDSSSTQSFDMNYGTGTARVALSTAAGFGAVKIGVKKNHSDWYGSAYITGIKLYKETKVWPERINQDIVYSDYEAALQTASVFKAGSNIFKSKNAIRYMSYENTDTAAFSENGTLYAPIDATALALDLYTEDTGTGYLLRSADNQTELTIQKSSCLQDSFYPVKTVAEHFGYTVLTNGDYLIADKYKVRANAINANYIANLISEFGSYEAAEAAGNTYYVSANVSVSGNGSEASPFKTIQEAANRASAGDRVIIKGGTYRETVTPANSGTAKNPIIFEAASGEQVTVSAFEEVDDFELYHDGIYVTRLPIELDFGSDFIMYGGDVLVEGRQPDTNTSGLIYPSVVTSPLWPTKGNIKTPSASFEATSPDGLSNGRDNALRGATYIGLKGNAWGNSFAKVTHSAKGVVSLTSVYFNDTNHISGAADWGYLTNSTRTLDQPGEWYVADRVLYIIPPSEADPEDLKVEAKQRYVTFDLTNKSCIQLRNISTIGGSVLMGGDSELNILYGGTHKFTSHFTYPRDNSDALYGSAAPTLTGKSGSYVAGKNNAVIGATFDTGAGSGIILGGRYGYVSGNTILDTGYGGSQNLPGILLRGAEAVNASSGGHDILYNTVCKTGRAALGVTSQNVDNRSDNEAERVPFIASEIAYNDFSYANILARDSGIIYIWGANMGNDLVKTDIHHNVLYNSVFTGSHSGVTLGALYADNYTGNGVFRHNIAYYEGDFTYDKSAWDNASLVGNELYLSTGVVVQGWSTWQRTYSTFENYNNMGKNSGILNHPNGFDKTVSENYPDGKIFKYGA